MGAIRIRARIFNVSWVCFGGDFITEFCSRHLMVRDGLLSPNSKLLPGAPSRAATPLDGGLIVWHHMVRSFCRMHFYDSDFVLASLMTKSRIIEDERDIPLSRVRNWC